LAAAGAEVIHLAAGEKGRGLDDIQAVHLKDLIRQTHLGLVEMKLRDTVTLLASGGIAMAEHVAKAIICGADGVVVDMPLLMALECRVCRKCLKGEPCPVQMPNLSLKRGAQRLMNLMGAWNNQLLEVLGAMGLREVRRLRGEVGRAMFVEDLQREIFGPLFSRPGNESGRREGE
jgi:glutamate synthase domain-containing protein 2